ncbi:MAG: AAA family ATPase [Lachnospiraceae bacterium]
MMTGLQGAGKTTTAAKLAGKFKIKGRKVIADSLRCISSSCDQAAYRSMVRKQGVEVFSMGDQHKPVDIAKAAMEHAKKQGMSVVILDTAGRLHIDEAMMEELQEIKENVHVDYSILVVDSMTGQDAVNVANNLLMRK